VKKIKSLTFAKKTSVLIKRNLLSVGYHQISIVKVNVQIIQ